TVTTTSLPNGQASGPYSATLAATGGTGGYSWQLTSGTMPPGLTLNPSGAITGTPTATAAATLIFKVTDSGTPAQNANSPSLTLTINPPGLTVTTSALVNGAVGTPYSQTLAANGGTPGYSWQLISGALPAGMTLNGTTG